MGPDWAFVLVWDDDQTTKDKLWGKVTQWNADQVTFGCRTMLKQHLKRTWRNTIEYWANNHYGDRRLGGMLAIELVKMWGIGANISNPITVKSTRYTGLWEILINWSLGDRSRVHLHGIEPRKIVLQHMWRKATWVVPFKPKKFRSKTEWSHHWNV